MVPIPRRIRLPDRTGGCYRRRQRGCCNVFRFIRPSGHRYSRGIHCRRVSVRPDWLIASAEIYVDDDQRECLRDLILDLEADLVGAMLGGNEYTEDDLDAMVEFRTAWDVCMSRHDDAAGTPPPTPSPATLPDLLPPVIRQVVHDSSATVVHELAAIDTSSLSNPAEWNTPCHYRRNIWRLLKSCTVVKEMPPCLSRPSHQDAWRKLQDLHSLGKLPLSDGTTRGSTPAGKFTLE